MSVNLSNFLPIFFGLILICSSLIILSPNPIHSVLFLILVFCNSTILLLMFGIEFLSIMLIIIYVGAIAILFLFVVMMLDIKVINHINDIKNYIFFCALIIISFIFETYTSTISIFNENFIEINNIFYKEWINFYDNITNTATIGQIIYTYFLSFVLIAGIILLIALIGAVVLTLQSDKKSIDTSTFKQISRLRENAIFNIK